jgi:hypothetical protein
MGFKIILKVCQEGRESVLERIAEVVVTMLDHNTVEQLEASQVDTYSTFCPAGDGHKMKAEAMLANFAAKTLDEIVLHSLPHLIRLSIPTMFCPNLPLIFLQIGKPG